MPARQDRSGRSGRVQIPSDEADEFVELARSGDLDAFAELYHASLPIVYGNLYRRCGDAALAEDLAADTYMRAMRGVSGFTGKSQDFLAWVMRIARNRFLDHVKSGRVRWEVSTDELPVTLSPVGVEEQALARVHAADLRRALSRLTDEQQEVVELRFLEGLSIAEVSQVVGRAEGAVKALQFRALRSLARILHEEGVVTRADEPP